MTARDGLLLLAGGLAVAGALRAVTTRRLVHAALWLVVSLGGLAGAVLALGAEVVALVVVLVYVGAVVVLVLFGLMLTHAPIGRSREASGSRARLVGAAVAGLATSALLAWALLDAVGNPAVDVTRTGETGAAGSRGAAQPLARSLFGSWVLPFELLSLLLLAALVAAFAVARGRSATDDTAADDTATHDTATDDTTLEEETR